MRLKTLIFVVVAGGCSLVKAAETTVRYDTDRADGTTVAFWDRDDRNWCAYNANELSFDVFGTGTVGEDTLDDPSLNRIERDGNLGMGIGLSYFFTRYLGANVEAYTESTGDHFVDSVGGNLIARFPLGESGVAPYILAGAARQIDPVYQWTWDAGGGFEFRFLPHVGVFIDARYVWADKTKDYGLGRLGVKFGW